MYLDNRSSEVQLSNVYTGAVLKIDTELEERVQGGRLFHSLDMRLK